MGRHCLVAMARYDDPLAEQVAHPVPATVATGWEPYVPGAGSMNRSNTLRCTRIRLHAQPSWPRVV